MRIYGAVRAGGYDVAAFTHNYTWRPIASMLDMFGTADLEINELGVVEAGREGFHRRAYGDYDDLRTLVANVGGLQRVLGLELQSNVLSREKLERAAAISMRVDTGKEKRLAVRRTELTRRKMRRNSARATRGEGSGGGKGVCSAYPRERATDLASTSRATGQPRPLV